MTRTAAEIVLRDKRGFMQFYYRLVASDAKSQFLSVDAIVSLL